MSTTEQVLIDTHVDSLYITDPFYSLHLAYHTFLPFLLFSHSDLSLSLNFGSLSAYASSISSMCFPEVFYFHFIFYVSWYFVFMYVRVKISDRLELELQTVLSCLWVLGVGTLVIWSFGRVANALYS